MPTDTAVEGEATVGQHWHDWTTGPSTLPESLLGYIVQISWVHQIPLVSAVSANETDLGFLLVEGFGLIAVT